MPGCEESSCGDSSLPKLKFLCLLPRCAALDTFEAMLASGSRPHAAVYSSIIDVLWQTGIPWAQAKALHLFNSAVQCVASSYSSAFMTIILHLLQIHLW